MRRQPSLDCADPYPWWRFYSDLKGVARDPRATSSRQASGSPRSHPGTADRVRHDGSMARKVACQQIRLADGAGSVESPGPRLDRDWPNALRGQVTRRTRRRARAKQPTSSWSLGKVPYGTKGPALSIGAAFRVTGERFRRAEFVTELTDASPLSSLSRGQP